MNAPLARLGAPSGLFRPIANQSMPRAGRRLHAGLIPGHCDAASRASAGMARDYPKAVTEAQKFIADSRT